MDHENFETREASFLPILRRDNDKTLKQNLQKWPPYPDPYEEAAMNAENVETCIKLLNMSAALYAKQLLDHADEAVKNFIPSYKSESPTHAALKLLTYAHFASYRDLTKLPIKINYEWGSWEFGVLDLIIQDQPNYEIGRTRRLGCECITYFSYEKYPKIIEMKTRIMQSYMSMGLLTGYFFTVDCLDYFPIELFFNEKHETSLLVFPDGVLKLFTKKARKLISKSTKR